MEPEELKQTLEDTIMQKGNTQAEKDEVILLSKLFVVADAGAQVLKLGAHEGECKNNDNGACTLHIKHATDRMNALRDGLIDLGIFLDGQRK